MNKSISCPTLLKTKEGKEYMAKAMKTLGLDTESQKDRQSFATTFSAWANNHPNEDFPNNIQELKSFDCRIRPEFMEQQNLLLQKNYGRELNAKRNTIRNYVLNRMKQSYQIPSEIEAKYKALKADKNTYFVTINEDEWSSQNPNKEIAALEERLKTKYDGVLTYIGHYYKNGALVVSMRTYSNLNELRNALIERQVDAFMNGLDVDLYYEALQNDSLGDILYYISNKNKEEYIRQIKKNNPYLSDEKINEYIGFLEGLENTPEFNLYVKQCIEWIKHDYITLPQDHDFLFNIFQTARKYKLDIQQMKHPVDIYNAIIANHKTTPGENFNVSKYNHIKHDSTIEVNGKTFEIYEVEDNANGQQDLVQALADNYPKGNDNKPIYNSPWCIATFNYNAETRKATPTASAKDTYWGNYPGRRFIAVYNGKLVACKSGENQNSNGWWDMKDSQHKSLDDVSTDLTPRSLMSAPSSDAMGEGYRKIELNDVEYWYKGPTLETVDLSIYDIIDGEFVNKVDISIYDDNALKFGSFAYYIEVVLNNSGTPYINGSISYNEGALLLDRLANNKDVPQKVFEAFQYLSDLQKKHTSVLYTLNDIKKNESETAKNANIVLEFLQKEIEKIKEEKKRQKEQEKAKTTNIRNNNEESEEIIIREGHGWTRVNQTEETVQAATEIANAAMEASTRRLNTPQPIRPRTTPTQEYNAAEEYESTDEYDENNEYEEYLDESASRISKQNKKSITGKFLKKVLKFLKERNLQQIYEKKLYEPENEDLFNMLKDILKQYHVEYMLGDLKQIFGTDALGACDFINKVIYLAENSEDRNALTNVEEFAHQLVELMGGKFVSQNTKKKNPDLYQANQTYSELFDLIEGTELYKHTFEIYKNEPEYQRYDGTPDIFKIKKEAIGKALATVIADTYDKKQDIGFFDKVKEFLRRISTAIKSIFSDTAKLDMKLQQIADSIFDGSIHNKYIKKLNDSSYKLVEYIPTIERQNEKDGGKALDIMQTIVRLGGIITGSLSYRAQGTVYRKEQDSLHDIDVTVPEFASSIFVNNDELQYYYYNKKQGTEASKERLVEIVRDNSYFKGLQEAYPNLVLVTDHVYFTNFYTLTASCIICDNVELRNKFLQMEGNFADRLAKLTQEEKDQIYLIDLFFMRNSNQQSIVDETFGLTLTDYQESFKSKLKFSRAKDLYDYQRFNPTNRTYRGTGILLQKRETDNNQLSLFDTDKNNNKITENTQQSMEAETFAEKVMEMSQKDNETKQMLRELPASRINSFSKIIADLYSQVISESIKALKLGVYAKFFTGDPMLDRKTLVQNFGPEYTPRAIMNKVKEILTERYGNKEAVTELLKSDPTTNNLSPEEFNIKVDNIYNNAQQILRFFEPLLSYSNIHIKAIEPVVPLGKDGVIVDEYEGNFLEQEIDSRENWQIDTLEQSSWASLDGIVKHIIFNIEDISIDNKGKVTTVADELGQKAKKEGKTVFATLLYLISDVVDSKDMIPTLQKNLNKYPWLQQILDVLCGKNTENITIYNEENPESIQNLAQNIQALFWKNFHKPFMKMVSIDITNNIASINSLNEKENNTDFLDTIAETIYEKKPLTTHSIYKRSGTLYLRNYDYLYKEVQNDEDFREFFSQEDNKDVEKYAKQYAKLYDILQSLGLDITKQQLVMFMQTSTSQKKLKLRDLLYNGFFNSNKENNASLQGLINNKNQAVFSAFYENYKNLAILFSPLSEKTRENSVTITIENQQKTFYSNVYPSLILDIIQALKQPKELAKQYIEREYLYDFHFNVQNGNKRYIPNVWLRELYEGNVKHSEMFEIVNLISSDGRTYMTQTEEQCKLTDLLAYFAKKSTLVGGYQYTYYPVGTFADAKAGYYIRNKIRSRKECIEGLVDLVIMELDHIKYVQAKKNAIARDNNNVRAIDVFDSKETIPSFPEININDFISELNNRKTKTEKRDYIKEVVTSIMEERNNAFLQEIKDSGLVENNASLKNVLGKEESWNDKLSEYYYNTTLANYCMDNMFIVDYNYFKDSDQKQKRFKFMYSPYSTAYTHCYVYNESGELIDQDLMLRKDDNGNPVEFSVLLADEIMASTTLSQVKETLKGYLNDKIINKKQYDIIIKGIEAINIADGQCYRSLKSYKRLLNMIGEGQNEVVHEAITMIENSLTNPDILLDNNYWQVVFNVMKPLVAGYETMYTGIIAEDINDTVNAEKDAERYSRLKSPIMHKNSEFLLLAIYPIIQSIISNSPKLRALNRFMEDFDIDKIQFESASKISNRGVINLNVEHRVYIENGIIYNEEGKQVAPKNNEIFYDLNTDSYFYYDGTDLKKCDFETTLYKYLCANCNLSTPRTIQYNDGYNNNVIHATPLNRWGIISQVPEHLLEHTKATLGTQFIKILEEDSRDVNEVLEVNINNTKVQLSVSEVKTLLQDVLVDYVQKSFAELNEQFNNPVLLKEFLIEQLAKQGISSINLEQALHIDPQTKKFDISLLNPIRKDQFLSFCASLIRKEMIQHRVHQGLLPQVTAYGLEDKVQLRYYCKAIADKNGIVKRTLIFNNREWLGKEPVPKEFQQDLEALRAKYKSYREYMDSPFAKAGAIAYMESAAPIFDNVFKRFIDKNTGLLNMEALLKNIDDDVLNALGYRIPTEAKHSMIPIKIKHFLPYQNASCIVTAIDWVFLSGSDFDIDKLFTLLPELAEENNIKEFFDYVKTKLNITTPKEERTAKRIINHIIFGSSLRNNETITDFYQNIVQCKIEFEKTKPIFHIKKLEFKTEGTDFESLRKAIIANSKEANNNLFLNLATSILQAEYNLKHIITPNTTEHVRTSASIIKALQNPENNLTKSRINELVSSQSNEFITKNYKTDFSRLSPIDPRLRAIEHYRNMTGLNLTALFAVFRAFLPIVQKTDMMDRAIKNPFMLNGNRSVAKNNGSVVNLRNEITGDYISDLISEYIAAAVDGAKDPLLAFLYFNTVTAPYAVFLTMRGYTTTEIALLLNQPVLQTCIEKYITENKTTSLSTIITEAIDGIDSILEARNLKIDDPAYKNLDVSLLATSIYENAHDIDLDSINGLKMLAFQKQVLSEFLKLIPIVEEFNNLSGISRNSTVANSVPSDTQKLIKKRSDYETLNKTYKNERNYLIGVESLFKDANNNPADRFEAILLEKCLLNIESLLGTIDFLTTKTFNRVRDTYNRLLGVINAKESDLVNLSRVALNYIYSRYLTVPANTDDFRWNIYSKLQKFIENTSNGEVTIPLTEENAAKNLLCLGVPKLVLEAKQAGILSNKGDIMYYLSMYPNKGIDVPLVGTNRRNTADNMFELRTAWESLYLNNRTVTIGKTEFSTIEIANILLLYNIFKGGIQSGNKNFIHAFPEGYEAIIPEYREITNTLNEMTLTDQDLRNIIQQYIQTYPTQATGVKILSPEEFVKFLKVEDLKVIPDVIIIQNNKQKAKLALNNRDIATYFCVNFGENTNILYKRVRENIYQRLDVLGNNGMFMEVGPITEKSIFIGQNPSNFGQSTIEELQQQYEASKKTLAEDVTMITAINEVSDRIFQGQSIDVLDNISRMLSNPGEGSYTIVINQEQTAQDTDKDNNLICSLIR